MGTREPTRFVMPKGRCFISHAYRDTELVQQLLSMLPEVAEPIIFPPIEVSPEQMVSNELINAILDCDELIYFDSPNSSDSFWVAFERDYALRAGKTVFRFIPSGNSILLDDSQPINLPITYRYADGDHTIAKRFIQFMLEHRHFDSSTESSRDPNFIPDFGYGVQLFIDVKENLLKGGYLVAFWSKNFLAELDAVPESAMSFTFNSVLKSGSPNSGPSRIIMALLDETPLPKKLHTLDWVQLYSDNIRSEYQRLDDLIVKLYWMIYKNRRNSLNRR